MTSKPIKTEQDYQKALRDIDTFWETKPNTARGDRLQVLITLVEAYEQKHHRIDPSDPIEAIKFRMEQLELKPADLADILAGRQRVSEILKTKRKLTLKKAFWMRIHYALVLAGLILACVGFGEAAGAESNQDAKQRGEERRQQQLPPDQPIDFLSLRKKADDLSARQHRDFKLHQIEIEFASSTLRINQAHFHYFHPLPGGAVNSRWERLQVSINTGGTVTTGKTTRSSYPGTIGASRQAFGDPLPTAAPGNILNPEDAVRRLNRGTITAPFSSPSYGKHPDQWKFFLQLIRVGAQYMAGTVTMSPPGAGRIKWIERAIQPSIHDPFFRQTAPAGKWVWWTVAQHADAPGERYEYVYIDAVTGKFTSQCAEPSGSRTATVAVPVSCTPPAKGR
jgi:HTH-type transcriptional regulator/antitoxin HigA